MTCEVCHKPIQPGVAVSDEEIYRPGEDYELAIEQDASERRQEIEEFFNQSRN